MNQKTSGSTGEKMIRRILTKQKIKYIFDSPVSFAFEKGTYPEELSRKRFDFVLIDEDHNPIACIEYDGQQHYEPNWYGRTMSQFQDACHSDDIKTVFCEEIKLPLLRVRYDQEDCVEDIMRDFLESPKRYTKKKHNPEMNMSEYWSPRDKYLQVM